jgi:flagellar basal-body rod protein FlgB
MIQRILFSDKVFPVVEASLDAYTTRQRAIASNMANVSTPGYRRMLVPFEDSLREALNTTTRLRGTMTNAAHRRLGRRRVDELQPEIVRADDRVLAEGENNIDIDLEMAELADTTIRYQATSRFMQRKFNMLRAAVSGRSG